MGLTDDCILCGKPHYRGLIDCPMFKWIALSLLVVAGGAFLIWRILSP